MPEAAVMLASKWEGEDPTGWWMSEKLDGVRAWWTGSTLLSRLGNTINAPAWFTAGLPKVPLDGELWCGRGQFTEAVSIVKNAARQDDWKVCAQVACAHLSCEGFDGGLWSGEKHTYMHNTVRDVPGV